MSNFALLSRPTSDPHPSAPLHALIASRVRDHGYEATGVMVCEVHEALKAGTELPYGIVGMFARAELREAGITDGLR